MCYNCKEILNVTKMLQIEGRNPVLEFLRNPKSKVQRVYLQEGINNDEKISEIMDICDSKKFKYEFRPKSYLDRISQTEVHQGVMAQLADFSYVKLEALIEGIYASKRDPFLMIVRESLYEHNLGAILRTAACSGVNGVILTRKSEITPNVIRTSMGATNYLDIVQTDIFSAIKVLKKEDIKIVGIEVLPESKFYYEENLKGPLALIIGGEDHPLSTEIASKCDFCVKIPLLSKINSLNMSVAAGIIMYEKLRQELV